MSLWYCEDHGLTGPMSCCPKGSRQYPPETDAGQRGGDPPRVNRALIDKMLSADLMPMQPENRADIIAEAARYMDGEPIEGRTDLRWWAAAILTYEAMFRWFERGLVDVATEAGAPIPAPDAAKLLLSDNGFPRRIRTDLYTPAERAIHAAITAVELTGAHVRLTDAVILLGKAREAVADFVDEEIRAGRMATPAAAATPAPHPRLTGCCTRCGARTRVSIGPVNDTYCIAVAPTCGCGVKGFNLWPDSQPPAGVVAPVEPAPGAIRTFDDSNEANAWERDDREFRRALNAYVDCVVARASQSSAYDAKTHAAASQALDAQIDKLFDERRQISLILGSPSKETGLIGGARVISSTLDDLMCELATARAAAEQARFCSACGIELIAGYRHKDHCTTLGFEAIVNRHPLRGGYEFFINEEWRGAIGATDCRASLAAFPSDPDDERVRVRLIVDDDALIADAARAPQPETSNG